MLERVLSSIIQRRDSFPNSGAYIALFPNSGDWGTWGYENDFVVEDKISSQYAPTGTPGETKSMSRSLEVDQPPQQYGDDAALGQTPGISGHWTQSLADQAHARRQAALMQRHMDVRTLDRDTPKEDVPDQEQK